MPLVKTSGYSPPPLFANGHVQTVFSSFRRVPDVEYMRKRISTPDDDFLDIDCCIRGFDRTAILSHGLEGNSRRPYVQGMVRALLRNGWNAVAWNFRGCGGEPNRKLRSYHCGETEDLETVLRFVLDETKSRTTAMIGFSAGGSMLLNFLGRQGRAALPLVSAAVAISVPCDLTGSVRKMGMLSNRLYTKRFLVMLCNKLEIKRRMFPGLVPDGATRIKTFVDFDSAYTAPVHGFKDAYDYYTASSCLPRLKRIEVPTLLLSALDDPLLSASCYPYAEAASSRSFHLETPRTGGHVGFVSFNDRKEYWSETRAIEFINRQGTTL